MDNRADILILATRPEKAANLRFLLRLSNFNIIHIADDIEAFNYLSYRQNSPHPLKLVVIDNADINQPFLQMLDELERRNALLPILLLRENKQIPIAELSSNAKVRNKIRQCDPSITHSCVREMLDAKRSLARAS